MMYSGPATEYEFRVRAFTSKREGADSDPLKNATDTASPSQPIISVLNCTGKLRKNDKSSYTYFRIRPELNHFCW